MKNLREWHNDLLAENTVKALIKNNFSASFVKTSEQAVDEIIKLIDSQAVVGIGGSQTIQELGVIDKLKERGNTILDSQLGKTSEERRKLRLSTLTSDVFLTGTNAITLDGQLVNVDAGGTRVAPMIFGPENVIVIAGINKIVNDVEEATLRIKRYTAPANAKRLSIANPCTVTGKCVDCQLPSRICNVTTIIHKRPSITKMHVFIIGETLGL